MSPPMLCALRTAWGHQARHRQTCPVVKQLYRRTRHPSGHGAALTAAAAKQSGGQPQVSVISSPRPDVDGRLPLVHRGSQGVSP